MDELKDKTKCQESRVIRVVVNEVMCCIVEECSL